MTNPQVEQAKQKVLAVWPDAQIWPPTPFYRSWRIWDGIHHDSGGIIGHGSDDGLAWLSAAKHPSILAAQKEPQDHVGDVNKKVVDTLFDEMPEQLMPRNWDTTDLFDATGAVHVRTFTCPYCTALVRNGRTHLDASPVCKEKLRNAKLAMKEEG